MLYKDVFTKLIGSPSTTESPAPDRHERKCLICNHPDRDAIEEEFLHWNSTSEIASRYDVSRDAIYRHAHAGNLFAERTGKMRSVLDLIIEQADSARVTGDTIIRAVRAYSCLTDDGRWVEPARRVIITHEGKPPAVPGEAASLSSVEPQASSPQNLIATLPIRNHLNPPVLSKTYRSNRNKTRGSLKPDLTL